MRRKKGAVVRTRYRQYDDTNLCQLIHDAFRVTREHVDETRKVISVIHDKVLEIASTMDLLRSAHANAIIPVLDSVDERLAKLAKEEFKPADPLSRGIANLEKRARMAGEI